jgi:hypothetical protein
LCRFDVGLIKKLINFIIQLFSLAPATQVLELKNQKMRLNFSNKWMFLLFASLLKLRTACMLVSLCPAIGGIKWL